MSEVSANYEFNDLLKDYVAAHRKVEEAKQALWNAEKDYSELEEKIEKRLAKNLDKSDNGTFAFDISDSQVLVVTLCEEEGTVLSADYYSITNTQSL